MIYGCVTTYIVISTYIDIVVSNDGLRPIPNWFLQTAMAPPSVVASPAATTPSFASRPMRPRRPPWRSKQRGGSVNALGLENDGGN